MRRAALKRDIRLYTCDTASCVEHSAHRVTQFQQQQRRRRKANDIDRGGVAGPGRRVGRGQNIVRRQYEASEAVIAPLIVSDADVNFAALQQGHLLGAKGLGQLYLHVGETNSVSR